MKFLKKEKHFIKLSIWKAELMAQTKDLTGTKSVFMSTVVLQVVLTIMMSTKAQQRQQQERNFGFPSEGMVEDWTQVCLNGEAMSTLY